MTTVVPAQAEVDTPPWTTEDDPAVDTDLADDLDPVLVVSAHPDDESFGLGAVIAALTERGDTVNVLCFTRGEASTLGVDGDDLVSVRAAELAAAGAALGVERVEMLDYPDGALSEVDLDELAGHVGRVAEVVGARSLLVFDHGGVTGHPDHQRATDAALACQATAALPVLAWTLPAEVADSLNAALGTGFVGRAADEIDVMVTVDRTRQEAACGEHRSQSHGNAALWRRLELLGPVEHLRRLR